MLYKSLLLIRILPADILSKSTIKFKIVVLPTPVFPIKTILLFEIISKSKFINILLPFFFQ
ncbi:hypothetical protein AGMMS49921_00920 [Endomicrobiia bacterium]|nr:hypothetical protein AGMMS49921_00920 [Endomicrobiia bacterium]